MRERKYIKWIFWLPWISALRKFLDHGTGRENITRNWFVCLFICFLNNIGFWMSNQPCIPRIKLVWLQWIIIYICIFLLKETAFGFIGFLYFFFPLCSVSFFISLILSQLLLFFIFYLVLIGFYFSRFLKFIVYISNILKFV